MRTAVLSLLILPMLFLTTGAQACAPLLDVTKRPLNGGEPVRLCDAYQGQVVLVVNTASKCGFTPQFEGLEALHAEYKDQGLAVIGFPSGDFGGQEYASEERIQEFCRLTYGVRFPMYEKTHAAKHAAGPLYRGLGSQAGEYPQWNFHKYLLNRDGDLVASFPSRVAPNDDALLRAIQKQL